MNAAANTIAIATPQLFGFNREDLETIVQGLDCEPKTVDVGGGHVESTAAYAARFIRAALAAQVLPSVDLVADVIEKLVGDCHMDWHPTGPDFEGDDDSFNSNAEERAVMCHLIGKTMLTILPEQAEPSDEDLERIADECEVRLRISQRHRFGEVHFAREVIAAARKLPFAVRPADAFPSVRAAVERALVGTFRFCGEAWSNSMQERDFLPVEDVAGVIDGIAYSALAACGNRAIQ